MIRVLRYRFGQLVALVAVVWSLLGLTTRDYDTTLAALVFLGAANLLLILELLERLPLAIRLRRGGDVYPVQRGGD